MNTRILQYLDEPERYFIFTPDELVAVVAPLAVLTLTMNFVVGLGAGAGVRYVGNTYGGTYTVGTSQVPFTVPSYTLVDAVLHYQWHQLGFAINATNLLDRSYVEGCYGGTVCSYGNRRNIIGSMRYSW